MSLAFGLPTALWFLRQGGWGPAYLGVLGEYLSFIILLGVLFVISGGILLPGRWMGTPRSNALLLGIGSVMASLAGTTGASMLLIRPLLRANRPRRYRVHTVVFFIFLVANIGGCLTPLGDPPLFMGYLRGIPFTWPLRLLGPWAAMVGALLVIYFLMDCVMFHREEGAMRNRAAGLGDSPTLEGWPNLLLLGGVMVILWASGRGGWPRGLSDGIMLALTGLSWVLTPRRVREANRFGFGPLAEVAFLFAGIFVTMVPALALLQGKGGAWGLASPCQYFWASGLLSSVLDNAPTYLGFTALASGALGTDPADLSRLLAGGNGLGERLLVAVSLGSVWMGALTYIGNGPNLMVKAIAEEAGVEMPSFLGYLGWALAVLIPLLALASCLLFRWPFTML